MREINHQQIERPFTFGKVEAVLFCPNHFYVPLTSEEYMSQLCKPDDLWKCPLCSYAAEWDDDNYEAWCDNQERIKCETCNGSGQVVCKSCGGSGWVGGHYGGEICCGGTDTCPACNGEGCIEQPEM
jgi:hypothetical protein